MFQQEFLVVFPDKNSLETFVKLKCFEMSLFGLKGSLERANVDPETSSMLQTVWIKISNVLVPAREVEIIKEMGALVAEPLVVDEVSLIKPGPVRFQGRCRNPTAIEGDLEFFINGKGVMLGFEVEGKKGGSKKGGKGVPPGPGNPDGSFDKDKDRPFREDNSKKSSSKFDRFGKIDNERESSRDGSMEEQMEGIDEGDLGTQKNKEVLVTPIAAFHPDIGFVQGNRISNLSDGHKSQISLDNQGSKKTHLEQVAVSDEGLTKENSIASGDNQ
jgi:hypothetical protein